MKQILNLSSLYDEVKHCNKCSLSCHRKNVVFSRGNEKANLLIIGEAPGEKEDISGLPFMGRSGNLLNKLLIEQSVDIENDVYICNIIKCRPPGNRKPKLLEINSCMEYLSKQISLVKPKCILTLGVTALHGLFHFKDKISSVRGTVLNYQGISLIPTYHPSFLLRNGPLSHATLEFIKDINLALSMVK